MLAGVQQSKQMIYFGELFPIDGTFWRQPGIVPFQVNSYCIKKYITLTLLFSQESSSGIALLIAIFSSLCFVRVSSSFFSGCFLLVIVCLVVSTSAVNCLKDLSP